jgi:hypothetical protein
MQALHYANRRFSGAGGVRDPACSICCSPMRALLDGVLSVLSAARDRRAGRGAAGGRVVALGGLFELDRMAQV